MRLFRNGRLIVARANMCLVFNTGKCDGLSVLGEFQLYKYAWRHKNNRSKQEQANWLSSQARYLLLALTLVSMYGAAVILRPYLHSIILALLLVSIFRPIHQWILRCVRERQNVAAFLAVLLVSLLVIVPASLFLSGLVRQSIDTFQKANAWVSEGNFQKALESPGLQDLKQSRLGQLAIGKFEEMRHEDFDLASSLLSISQGALEFTGKRVLPVMKATGTLLIGFFIMLFVMFFVFRDGHHMLEYLLHLSPLSTTQERALLNKVKEVSRAVFLGIFLTAMIQAILAMIAFWVVGIPAVFWGTVLGFASIIPIVGTALVWVPATAYLLVTGHGLFALLLALWCIFVIGSVDNLVRPIFMGGRLGMSYVVVFFAILGGIHCFGPVGIIYGPLIFGLCAVCLYIYEIENDQFLSRQDRL